MDGVVCLGIDGDRATLACLFVRDDEVEQSIPECGLGCTRIDSGGQMELFGEHDLWRSHFACGCGGVDGVISVFGCVVGIVGGIFIVGIGFVVGLASGGMRVLLRGRKVAAKTSALDGDLISFGVNVKIGGGDTRELDSDVQLTIVDAIRESGLACD